MEFFVFAIFLGLIPAAIASKKGSNFMLWWFYGTMLFIVALPVSILMKPADQTAVAGMRKCPKCAEHVQAEAQICKHCKSELTPLTATEQKRLKAEAKNQNNVPGWLVVVAIGCVIYFVWYMASSGGSPSGVSSGLSSQPIAKMAESLAGPQNNAVRSAKQYLSMRGFSRNGLIHQLSSDYGDGYNIADATAAVDSLNIDWNNQAVRSAKQYLSMQGFSCKGLIQQLSSDAGDKYTVSQATYGARQAGVCQ